MRRHRHRREQAQVEGGAQRRVRHDGGEEGGAHLVRVRVRVRVRTRG